MVEIVSKLLLLQGDDRRLLPNVRRSRLGVLLLLGGLHYRRRTHLHLVGRLVEQQHPDVGLNNLHVGEEGCQGLLALPLPRLVLVVNGPQVRGIALHENGFIDVLELLRVELEELNFV